MEDESSSRPLSYIAQPALPTIPEASFSFLNDSSKSTNLSLTEHAVLKQLQSLQVNQQLDAFEDDSDSFFELQETSVNLPKNY